MVKEKTNPIYESDELASLEKELILHNDDFNTFDHVIDTLIEVCGHDSLQAEQCALAAHFNGKCSVKSGTFDFLKPFHDKMIDKELTVTIS
jgi:ATP-dependent Clp protease adaptor protein ClpS